MISGSQIRSLRVELAEAGVFEHRTAATLGKLGLCLAGVAACVAGLSLLPLWTAVVLVPVAAVLAVTAAMTGHEASHGSLSASKRFNAIYLHLVFPLFGGMGVLHWSAKHDRGHHGDPNVVGADPDLNLWPMGASSVEYARSGRLRRFIQRDLQGYLFWLATSLLAFNMRVESVIHLVRRTRRQGLDRAVVLDGLCLALHLVAWVVVPALIVGPAAAIGFYVALWLVGGVVLSAIFAPAHMGLPLMAASGNRWRHQLETTRNLAVPRWLGWLMVGLHHQVEHHFFPRIPHQHLPRASEVTRAWCARHGQPHLTIGFAAGLADVTRFMFEAWRTDPLGAAAPVAPTEDDAESDAEAAAALPTAA